MSQYQTIKEKTGKVHLIPKLWYHGTNTTFDSFNLSYLAKNWRQSILGIYLTQYMTPPPYGSTAIEYAKYTSSVRGGEPHVAECTADIENPLILDSDGWYSSNGAIDKQRSDIMRWLRADKYDSVLCYDHTCDNVEDADHILIVLDPHKVKIRKWTKVIDNR